MSHKSLFTATIQPDDIKSGVKKKKKKIIIEVFICPAGEVTSIRSTLGSAVIKLQQQCGQLDSVEVSLSSRLVSSSLLFRKHILFLITAAVLHLFFLL